jgi:hypothetical protein
MSLGSNTENKNTASSVQTRSCCSFCKNSGHNISTCNDSRFAEFQELCIEKYTNRSRSSFRNWLDNISIQNPDIVKAYAVRHCGATIRQHMHTYIDYIVVKIGEISSERVEYQRPSNTQSNWNDQHNDMLTPSSIAEMLLALNPHERLMAGILLTLYSIRGANQYNTRKKFKIQTSFTNCLDINECECGICYENKQKTSFIKLNCGHEFCKDCIKNSLKNVRSENPQCAFCRAEIKNMELSSQTMIDDLNDVLA